MAGDSVRAWAKAAGEARFVADMDLPGMLHVALARSALPHARITRVDATRARGVAGAAGVFTAADLCSRTYGRSVRDVPVLARERARYIGEPVAAVVADSRRAAEAAAALVEITCDEMPAVLSAEAALAPGAPAVHDEPWNYPHAAVGPGDGRNLQSRVERGSREDASAALGRCDHVVDRVYSTPSGHQGYLEPQACVVAPEGGRFRLWVTNKSPYRLRAQAAECLGLAAEDIVVEPVPLGGDFGGKGSPGNAILGIELARLTGRPVKLVLRYGEELTATAPRHPARVRVRVGCDREGRLAGMMVRALLDGGAYGGLKPLPDVGLHGIGDCALAYHVPALHVESLIAYTNTVPRGHMRSPGAPQAVFAVESALDELAAQAGLEAVEIRRRNLLRDGMPTGGGRTWAQARGGETLAAALACAATGGQEPPPGWCHGSGVAVYVREAPPLAPTSVRLLPTPGGGIRAEVPIPETGTGSHTVVRNLLAAELAVSPEAIEVAQVSTGELPHDPGVGGSRVTVGMADLLSRAAREWRGRPGDGAVVVAAPPLPGAAPVASYCAQVASVAVDPGTGQVKVLDIVSAVDVGRVINPGGHQMQIDGGTVMGYGFACLEDLTEEDGQVMAANLGEFKIPSMRDIPVLRTVLVPGGRGLAPAGVKPVGELANVGVAAAVANAIAAATGCRIRGLPLTAERVYWAMRQAGGAAQDPEGERG